MLKELQNYYSSLLIVQYNGKPKAKATVDLLTKILYGNGNKPIILQIQDSFNKDTAKGKQLDIIGKWVGVDRKITHQLYAEHNWFSLIVESGATSPYQGGFALESTFDDNDGGFLTSDLVANEYVNLTDENFLFLINLKIIKNSINHTAKNIDDAIHNLLGGVIYTTWDLTNHILYYNVPTQYFEIMEVAKIKGVLPAPMPVTINIRMI